MQQERPGAPLPFEACENFRIWAVKQASAEGNYKYAR